MIRPERPGDEAPIAAVHDAAFGGPDEAGIVARLRAGQAWIPGLSLVAEVDGVVVGHSVSSRAWLVPDAGDAGRAGPVPILALGPVGVLPAWQRRGVGSGLVAVGIEAARGMGERLIVVLGHSTYYPRFGFRPARAVGIEPPAAWPDAAWMALDLRPGAGPLRGRVRYDAAFGPL